MLDSFADDNFAESFCTETAAMFNGIQRSWLLHTMWYTVIDAIIHPVHACICESCILCIVFLIVIFLLLFCIYILLYLISIALPSNSDLTAEGSCGFEGRAGRLLIRRLVVRSQTPPVCIFKCAWARYWTPRLLRKAVPSLCECVCMSSWWAGWHLPAISMWMCVNWWMLIVL